MKAWFKAMVVATAMVGPMAASVSTATACIGVTPRYGVVHGRSLAALIEAAERADAVEARPLVEEAIARGGLADLANGWTLARVMVSAGAPGTVARALAEAVSGDDAALAGRTAVILRVVGVGRPDALAVVLAQTTMSSRGREVLADALARMPGSERRTSLLGMVAATGVSAR